MHLAFIENFGDNNRTLDEDESKHCIRVLRMKKGSPMMVTDGKGGVYHVVIANDNPKKCELEIVSSEIQPKPRPYFLEMCVAPTKNIDRFEWFVEKAVEIGVDKITPLFCDNSERDTIRIDRVQKVVVSAMKQSLNAYATIINEPITFSKLMQDGFSGDKFIAHCYDKDLPHIKTVCENRSNVRILIGPEGDFSPKEVELAIQQHYVPISLGKSRLRTETAAIVACHSMALVNNG